MKKTIDIDISPLEMATEFCEWDDEKQAQFFIECAALATQWSSGTPWLAWYGIGGHLRDCECSTDDARQMLIDICEGITSKEPGHV